VSTDLLGEIEEAKAFVQGKIKQTPAIGVVLGSGLGSFAESLADRIVIPFHEIPHMPSSKVVGHAGNLVLGTIPSATGRAPTFIACLQGRVHAYEGHALHKVVFASRLVARLGAKAVLLTNAAGGVRRSFTPGDLMLISDHLNLMGQNPLVGQNNEALGPRFPDMTEAYSKKLRGLALVAARAAGIDLKEGVYAALLGPTYETPAEIEMLRRLGADAVGMSTVPEVIALRHMAVPVAAISCITNMAAGMSGQALDHSEVEATAKANREKFILLLSGWSAAVAAEVSA